MGDYGVCGSLCDVGLAESAGGVVEAGKLFVVGVVTDRTVTRDGVADRYIAVITFQRAASGVQYAGVGVSGSER